MQEEKDDIEKFFAKRLGEKEFPFEEEQWEILAQRLDDAAPVKVPFWIRFKKRIGYILIPIITFLIGWYWHSGTEQLEPVNTLPVQVPTEMPANSNDKAGKELKEIISDINGEPAQEEAEGLNEESLSTPKMAASEVRLSERKTENQPEPVTVQASARRPVFAVPPIGVTGLSYYNPAPLNLMTLQFPLPEITGGVALPITDSVRVEEDEFKPYWSATLLMAPDFNSTNMRDLYNSLGQTVGLQFSRNSTENVRWNFGLLLNNKIYQAGKGEYSPTRGYSGGGVEPDLTDARCLVLEIPVSLGLRLFKTNGGSVWTNVGVSSFVFLTERYSYFYEVSDPSLATGWEGKNENQHIAAALGFALVYAHQLSERSSLIFEPYFKTTIQPVGHGNVDLLSSGLNVGFNYKLFSKN